MSNSVTNLEFLEARAKGIPVYAFVEKSVLALLPVTLSNMERVSAAIVRQAKRFDADK